MFNENDNLNSSGNRSQDSDSNELSSFDSDRSIDTDDNKIAGDDGSSYRYEGSENVKNSEDDNYVPNFTLWSEQGETEKTEVFNTDSSTGNEPVNAPQVNYMEESARNSEIRNSYNQQNYQSAGGDTSRYTNTSSGSGFDSEGPKKKRTPKFVKLIGAAALFGVIAGLSFQGASFVAGRMFGNNNLSSAGNGAQLNGAPRTQLETTKVVNGIPSSSRNVAGVVEETMPSIVSITSTVTQTYSDFFGNRYNEDAEGSGSGIIIDKNEKELLIVTNNHVISSAKTIAVKFIDDKVVEAVVKGTDEAADLAVISIDIKDIETDTLAQIKVAKLGDSDIVKVGELAIAIGNAMGYGQSVTVGYVSAKNRTIEVEDRTMTLLQTDAAINPGNSGGALLNEKGEVIGINSVKFAASTVESIGFAIPISSAVPIINELMKREVIKEEDKGFLGVSGNNMEEDNIYKMPAGVYVNEITEDSPAAKAGILQGDIITKLNDIEIVSFQALRERVMSYRAGTEVELAVMRRVDGVYKEIKIKVVLGNRPADTGTEQPSERPDNPIKEEEEYPYNGDGSITIPYGDEFPDIYDFFR